MKNIIILISILLLASCSHKEKEAVWIHWKTEIEVTYSDRTKDTLYAEATTREWIGVKLNIKTSEPTFWGAEAIEPCLEQEYGWKKELLACGVRSFKIINQIKTEKNER